MLPLIRIALRNVVRYRRRSLIALSAVFLALFVMVCVRGFLNGVQSAIREGVIDGQTGAVQVHRKGFLAAMQGASLELDVPADDAFLSRIARAPHVTAVAPRILFGGMVNANDRTVFSLMSALDPVREAKVCPRRFDHVDQGALVGKSAPDGSDLTGALLRRIGARIGDRVAVLSNDRDGVLNAVEVGVAGSFPEAGLFAADKKVMMLPLGPSQELLRMPGRATEIAVAVDDLANVGATVAALRASLGDEYEVSSWHDVAPFLDDLISTQDAVLGMIVNTFLFMALLGIANTMLMSVRERTREIGTMMAVGVRRRQILALFLVEAAILGLAGGALGLGAGGALIHHWAGTGLHIKTPASSVPFLVHPFITPAFIARVFIVSTVGATLAALYPALRASRLRPVEALNTAA